ncbi:MAG TPA: NAD(P)H:quinone oxidoreductase [Spirochaetia bacterium]|nr:NAD(P)H:quinone oxidoreductase [Spirochaetia bacterium]
MSEKAKIAIIYYSAMGHANQVARAFEQGAKAEGAEVRLRKVRELATPDVVATNPAWKAHVEATKGVPEATLADLEWANGYVFGSPTRYGVMAAQLKQFFDAGGQLWMQGKLSHKPVTAFAGAMNPHGGQVNTINSIYAVMHHWGTIIIPTGYTDSSIYAAGGSPYGVIYTAPARESAAVDEPVLAAARYMGARLARYAEVLAANRDRLLSTGAAATRTPAP